MPKTTLTRQDAVYISWARRIRRHHHVIRKRFRKQCADCGHAWGRYGCAEHLWATDFLSQFSLILIPDRPARPRHRHRPAYTRIRDQVAADVKYAYQRRMSASALRLPTA